MKFNLARWKHGKIISKTVGQVQVLVFFSEALWNLVLIRAPTRSEIRTFGPNSDHFGKWSENGPNLGFFCKMVQKCSDSVTAIWVQITVSNANMVSRADDWDQLPCHYFKVTGYFDGQLLQKSQFFLHTLEGSIGAFFGKNFFWFKLSLNL